MKYLPAAAFAVFAFTATALAATGNDFLMDAARGNNAEIMMGTLAIQKAQSADVRKFGQTLVTDHSHAKTEVGTLATAMSVSVPSDVKPAAQQAYDKLAQMSGTEFDRAFVHHMVEDHQKDIAAFTKEAAAKDGKVSELAAKQLPTLKRHLVIAQSLQGPNTGSMQGMQPPQRIQ